MSKVSSYINEAQNHRILTIALTCAPVLMGLKTANTVNINAEDINTLLAIIQDTGLTAFKLYENKGKCLIMLYREDNLRRHLKKPDVKKFLLRFGYDPTDSFQYILFRLVKRFQYYRHLKSEFPHELGVFLEYPIEDMEGFIIHKGKNYRLCGYWKVYDDVGFAKEKFRHYDYAKEEVRRLLGMGFKLSEIAVKTAC